MLFYVRICFKSVPKALQPRSLVVLTETVVFLDEIKDMGFEFAFKSGLSIAISDIHIPQDIRHDIFPTK